MFLFRFIDIVFRGLVFPYINRCSSGRGGEVVIVTANQIDSIIPKKERSG